MPNIANRTLVNDLTARIRASMENADTNADGAVSAAERTTLAADVRPLADDTADAYLAGGALPVDAYVNAYRTFVDSAVEAADADSSGTLSELEQQNLSAPVYASMVALRAQPTTPPASASALDAKYAELAAEGWNDDRIMEFINLANSAGKLDDNVGRIWEAVIDPVVPTHAHAGAAFLEALSWYVDRTLVGSGDGHITLGEIQAAIEKKGQEYFSLVGNPRGADARRQTWKFIEKLRILEKELTTTGKSAYPYDANRMSQINTGSAWNQAHTIDSSAAFQRDVIAASHHKPVLVKFGLPYCIHCLLLEHTDAVKKVHDNHRDDIDVKKVWWNPNDPSMADITRVAREQGVQSSPYFIVYKDGKPARAGYAFPDENGKGMEDLLRGMI